MWKKETEVSIGMFVLKERDLERSKAMISSLPTAFDFCGSLMF